ncbi:hypothetical protein D9M68_980840 [compost metagenome]
MQVIVFPVPDIHLGMLKFYQSGVFHRWYGSKAQEKLFPVFTEAKVPLAADIPFLGYAGSIGGDQHLGGVGAATGMIINAEIFLKGLLR